MKQSMQMFEKGSQPSPTFEDHPNNSERIDIISLLNGVDIYDDYSLISSIERTFNVVKVLQEEVYALQHAMDILGLPILQAATEEELETIHRYQKEVETNSKNSSYKALLVKSQVDLISMISVLRVLSNEIKTNFTLTQGKNYR